MKWYYILFLICFFSCQTGEKESPPQPASEQSGKETSSSSASSTEINSTLAGISFNNELKETDQFNRLTYEYFYNGGGVAVGDINNDGLADIYFTGNLVPDKLYLNLGDFKFKDITTTAGIPFENDWHTGVTMVDINADGYLDIYVNRSGPWSDPAKLANRLYVNNKDNTFTESADVYGLADTGYGVQAAFFDGDLDGDLDVIVLNNPAKKPAATNLVSYSQAIATGEFGTDRYYENKNGKYIESSAKAGIKTFGYRHGISVGDVNNDGWPDMYISGDFDDPDYLFINDGDGTFTNRIDSYMNQISMFSMGNDQADINHDGFMDIFVADMTPGDHERSKQNMASMNMNKFFQMTENGFHHQYMMNTLQLNNGGKSFSNVAHLAGVASTDWSWSTLFLDWDMDGHDDLFVTNGVKRDVLNNDVRLKINKLKQEQKPIGAFQVLNLMPSNKINNFFYRNNGELDFENKSRDWLPGNARNSNGAAYADLDNDGDLDLVVNNVDDVATLIQNNASNHFIKIKFKGIANNPFGIGSRAIVYTPDRQQTKDLNLSRGFCSSVEPILHFGLGETQSIDKIDIFHGKGLVTTVENPGIDQLIEIDLAKCTKAEIKNSKSTLFAQVIPQNLGINFNHQENKFDDYREEILLPHRYSRNGPFMSKGDVNGDGLEDLFVGGARDQAGEIYVQNKGGKFTLKSIAAFQQDKNHEDMKSVFFDADGDGDQDLYVVSGGYEENDGSNYYQDRLYLNDGKGNFAKSNLLPSITSSGQAIAVADIDGDGDIDIFRGGRIFAGRYPQSTPSYLFMNNQGNFKNEVRKIEIAGLVTDAAFAFLNDDQLPDLIVSGEWMPVTYFLNKNGTLNESKTIGPSGWYHSLFVDDFDGNQSLDIIAGNIGENNKFHPGDGHPLHVYAYDFDDNGSNDIVLSKMYKGHQVPSRGRECSSQQMPFIQDKFPTYQAFAEASLEEVYGDKLKEALHVEADNFSHLLFINPMSDGTGVSLPRNAQRSPLMAFEKISINGRTYLVGAGNLFHAEVETSRYDAGIGVLMTYENGALKSISSEESGLLLRGDVKDLEVLSLANGDKLLVASRNNDGLLIYMFKA
jgi:hypothetical protein